MAIKFLLLVNKQGQTRLAKYFSSEPGSTDERRALEGEVVRKCLARTDRQCSFFEHRAYRVVYRRYASLFFMVGVDESEVCGGCACVGGEGAAAHGASFTGNKHNQITQHKPNHQTNNQQNKTLN